MLTRIKEIKRKELLRFLVGGGSAVIIDYVTYKLLLYFGMDVSLAKAISFICGSIVGFIINKLWTFESKSFYKSEILRYVILYAITAYINADVNDLALNLFQNQLFAFFCATCISTVLNFIGQKFFVFTNGGSQA